MATATKQQPQQHHHHVSRITDLTSVLVLVAIFVLALVIPGNIVSAVRLCLYNCKD